MANYFVPPLKIKKGTNSFEYQVVQANYDRLVSQIKAVVGEFARKAFSAKLISAHNRDEAHNDMMPADGRANLTLGVVLSKIEDDEANFDLLVSILRDIPDLKHLGDDLVQSVHKLDTPHTADRPSASGNQKPHRKSHSKGNLVDDLDSGVISVTSEFSSLGVSPNSPRFSQHVVSTSTHSSPSHNFSTQQPLSSDYRKLAPALDEPQPPKHELISTRSHGLRRQMSTPTTNLEASNIDHPSEKATMKPSYSNEYQPQSEEMPTDTEKALLAEELVEPPTGIQESEESSGSTCVVTGSQQIVPNLSAEQDLSDAENSMRGSLDSLKRARHKLRQSEAENKQKEAENSDLKEKVKQLDSEKCELEEKLKEAEDLVKSKEEEIKEIKEKKDTEIDSLKTEIKSLKQKVARIEKEKEVLIQSQETKLQEFTETHKKECEKLKGQLKDANAEKEKIEEQLRHMNTQLALKEMEKRAEVAEKEVEIQKKEKEVKELQMKLWQKNSELNMKDKELLKKEKELAEQKAKTAEEGRTVEEMKRKAQEEKHKKELEEFKEKHMQERRMSEQRERHLSDQLSEERRQGVELKEKLQRLESQNSQISTNTQSSIDSIPEGSDQ